MNPAEQEELFKTLAKEHPTWGKDFLSGYVHGANDEAERRDPRPGYVKRAKDKVDLYGRGYLLGFAMRRGMDAEIESWFRWVPSV